MTIRKIQKFFAGVLTVSVLTASVFGGSALASETETTSETATEAVSEAESETTESTGTRTIVDHTGAEVVLPEKIERVVISSILPLPSVYCLFRGSADDIVGIHPSSMAAAENSYLLNVFPEIANADTSFVENGEVNVEQLLALKPDVVFYNASNTEEREMYDNAGRSVAEEIKAVTSTITDEDKPKVLILFNYADGIIKTSGSNFFGQYWIETAGGINVAADLSGTPEINMEQVYEWDPDIIFITNFSPYQPDDLYNNTIDGDDWSNVTAVKNQQVYKFPLGMYRWFPPASDTPLVLKWLASKIQPDLFKDMDMDQEIKDYYEKYYHVTLTDEDLQKIYNPVSAAAGV